MSLAPHECNAPSDVTPVTSVTSNAAPLSNAERQRTYRERQRLKKGQAIKPSGNDTNSDA